MQQQRAELCAGETVATVQLVPYRGASKHWQSLLNTDHSANAEQVASLAQQACARRSTDFVGGCMCKVAADLLAQALELAGARAPGAVGVYSGQEMLTALARDFCEGDTLEDGGSWGALGWAP